MSDLTKMSVEELTDGLEYRSSSEARVASELARRLREAEDEVERMRGVVRGIPRDAIIALPNDWCVGCFNATLRRQRKCGIKCSECYDGDLDRDHLDDDNEPAITAIIKWAQAAEAARQQTEEVE